MADSKIDFFLFFTYNLTYTLLGIFILLYAASFINQDLISNNILINSPKTYYFIAGVILFIECIILIFILYLINIKFLENSRIAKRTTIISFIILLIVCFGCVLN